MKLARKDTLVTKDIDRWSLDGKLSDAIDFLRDEMLNIPEPYQASATLDISSYLQYGDPAIEISIAYYRPETDAELAARQAAADILAKQAEDSQRAEYERLKIKFETGPALARTEVKRGSDHERDEDDAG